MSKIIQLFLITNFFILLPVNLSYAQENSPVSFAPAPNTQVSLNFDTGLFLGKGLMFCGEMVPITDEDVFRGVEQNLILLAEAKSRIWLSLRRAARYQGMVEKALKEAKMPDDIKYLPSTISGYSPIFSNYAGKGMWRLSENDATELGLQIDKNIDQRLDPVIATQAALKKLQMLKDSYGSWNSAIAAYLIGTNTYQKAVDEAGGEKNFYQLYFSAAQGNTMYVMLAGKILFSHPDKFGYKLSPHRGWPTMSEKQITTTADSTLRELSKHYKIDYKSFRDINPHLLSDIVPKGTIINVPLNKVKNRQ